jgi:esterase/lipase
MSEKIFHKGVCGILEHETLDEIAVLVHGHSTHKDTASLLKAAEILKKLSISSFRIDLDNRGESDLDFEKATVSDYIKNVEIAIEYVKSLGYKKIDLFGSSCGGIVCMNVALKHEINRMFLKAPVSDYPTQRELYYGMEKIKEWKEKGFMEKVTGSGDRIKMSYNFYEDSKKYVMFDKVKDIKCPVMIVHGDSDDNVPLENSKRVVKEFPNAKLYVVKGANHQLGVDGDYSELWKVFEEFFS